MSRDLPGWALPHGVKVHAVESVDYANEIFVGDNYSEPALSINIASLP